MENFYIDLNASLNFSNFINKINMIDSIKIKILNKLLNQFVFIENKSLIKHWNNVFLLSFGDQNRLKENIDDFFGYFISDRYHMSLDEKISFLKLRYQQND